MKVSIIVPVYNSEKYLSFCLESLVTQTLDNIEIIIIDDASSDNSLKIIHQYARKYPSIIKIVENKENKGQGYSRNLGITLAQGEYIGFVDSDDYVNESMYKNMYEGAVANSYPEVVTTGIRFVTDNYYLRNNSFLCSRKGSINEPLLDPSFIFSESPSVCNKLFRHDTIKNKPFLEGRMWEDIAFSYAKLFNSNRVLTLSNADYFYRRRIGDGVSSKGYNVNLHLLDIFRVAEKLEEEIVGSGRYEIFKDQIRFIQISAILERVNEIYSWNINDSSKEDLAYFLIIILLKKYGDFRTIPVEELSAKVGFLELERAEALLTKRGLSTIMNPEELIAEKLSSLYVK